MLALKVTQVLSVLFVKFTLVHELNIVSILDFNLFILSLFQWMCGQLGVFLPNS